MQISDRAVARNQEWRVVKITEVNPSSMHFAAEDQYGTPILLTLMGGIIQEIPAVGEQWYVSRQGSDWRLENRLELPDTRLPITSMKPGDARVEAAGDITVIPGDQGGASYGPSVYGTDEFGGGHTFTVDGNIDIKGSLTEDLKFGGHKGVGAADPSNPQDLSTKNYVDSLISSLGGNTYPISQTAHGFSVGNVLYYTGTAFAKAQANTADTAEVVGIVSAVADANSFTLQAAGEVTTLSGLTAGLTYFLSDSTAGLLTSTPPSTNGSISKPLGVAVSTTGLFFVNMRGEVIQNTAGTNITVSSFAGGPPAGALDGDIWIATGVDANGIRWQFQYNASSASTYKWEFIGGPALMGSSGARTLATTGAFDLTGGPSLVIARTGDYQVEIGMAVTINSASSQYAPTQLQGSVSGLMPVTCAASPYTTGFASVTAYGTGVFSSLVAQTLNLSISIANGTVSTNFGPGTIRVTPIRTG